MSFLAVGTLGGAWLGAGTAAGIAGGAMLGGAAGSLASKVTGVGQPKSITPNNVSPGQIGADTFNTQLALQPQILGGAQQYAPQYVDLQNSTTAGSLLGGIDTQAFLAANPEYQAGWDQAVADQGSPGAGSPEQWLQNAMNAAGYSGEVPRTGGLLDVYSTAAPQLTELSGGFNTAQRYNDVADATALGGQLNQAQQNANPELFDSLSALGGTTSDFTRAQDMAGQDLISYTPEEIARLSQPGELQQTLESQAAAELALGDQLSPEERRAALVGARDAYSSRGIGSSNSALAAEVLNTYQAQQAREAQRRGFAQSVDQSGYAQRQGNANTLLNTAQQSNATQQQAYGQYLGLDQAALARQQAEANARLQTRINPYQQLTSGSQSGLNPGNLLGLGQANAADALGAATIDPYNPAITSIYAGNQANQLAAQVANANNKSSTTGSLIGALGQLGGGYLAGGGNFGFGGSGGSTTLGQNPYNSGGLGLV